MDKVLGVITGTALLRVVRPERTRSTYPHSRTNSTMYATNAGQHRSAPGQAAHRLALLSKDRVAPAKMDKGTRAFLHDITRADHRNTRPFGHFHDAAKEIVSAEPSLLPHVLAVYDLMQGELLAAAGVRESAVFNDEESAIDETTANHEADSRFVIAMIHPTRENVEREIDALEVQKVATLKRILCRARYLATLDGKTPA